MENEILIAIFTKLLDEKISHLQNTSGSRGPRGHSGPAGESFNFSEHEETIKGWAKDFALKFEDLTDEQIQSLKGRDGRNGKDGRDGQNGNNFEWEEHRESIDSVIREHVNGLSENLKLKFSDLNNDDIELIRGPRGRDGRDGRGFIFEEYKSYFDTLKIKFSDYTEEEKQSLRLRFEHLSEQEKKSLKLSFEDLTDEDILKIRGARGPKGQRGSRGNDGLNGTTGPRGIRGLPGATGARGISGAQGRDGRDGSDGNDAPIVVDIEAEERLDKLFFTFFFSDGSEITTKGVDLPKEKIRYIFGGGGYIPEGGSGGGGEGTVKSVNDILPDDDGNISLFLADLLDVDVTTLEDGFVLTWDIVNQKWYGKAPGEAVSTHTQELVLGDQEITDLQFNSATVVDFKVEYTSAIGTTRQPGTVRGYFADQWYLARDSEESIGIVFSIDPTSGQISCNSPDAGKLQWRLAYVFSEETQPAAGGQQEIPSSDTVEVTDLVFDSAVVVDFKTEYTIKKGSGRQPGVIRGYFTDQWYLSPHREDTVGVTFIIDDTTGQVSAINDSGDAILQWKTTSFFNKEA